MSGLQWRRFAREDWDAYGGAEAFPGGGEPWIAELEVDGEYAVAILDATGLCVMAGEEQEVWIAVRRGASYEAADEREEAAVNYVSDFDKRHPYVKAHHARGCDKMVCAYSQGAARCRNGKVTAERTAFDLALALCVAFGHGWKPHVHQNLGWHGSALSADGRWYVTVNAYYGKVYSYTAFLSERPFSCSGRWAEQGKTPRAAVENTRRAALAEVAHLQAIIETAQRVP